MGGNIGYANPTLVLPQTLSTSFAESRNYLQLRNMYHDGRQQAFQLANTSRRSFKLAKRLKVADLSTLRTFFETVDGGLQPFYFYNPFDAAQYQLLTSGGPGTSPGWGLGGWGGGGWGTGDGGTPGTAGSLITATIIGSNYDATGASPIGRYTVVFSGDWTQSTSFQRTDVSELTMIEVE